MEIDCLILGLYETNCYILRRDEQIKDCLIIDAGLDCGPLVDFLRQCKLNPVALILTHGHIDHIAGVNALRDNFPDIKVYIHQLDAEMLEEPFSNLSAMTGAAFTTEPSDFTLQEGDIIEQAGVKLHLMILQAVKRHDHLAPVSRFRYLWVVRRQRAPIDQQTFPNGTCAAQYQYPKRALRP